MNKKILYLIEQTGTLMQQPRSHKRNLGNTFDTVASHSFHVAIIAYCLSRMEGLSHDEATKLMAMGLLHDVSEARTGDLDFVTKNYAKVDEKKAVSDQFSDIGFGRDLEKLVDEFEDRNTTAAKCAKDADAVEQMYQERVLAWQGNKLAEKWFKGKQKLTVPHLRTEFARKIMELMKESDPQEWWWSEFVDKNLNLGNLNSER